MKKTKRNSHTSIDKAHREVKGFRAMYSRLKQKVIGGFSESTLKNYGRCIAKIRVHFDCRLLNWKKGRSMVICSIF